MVRLLPEMVAGPDTMPKETGRPDEAVAASANAASPNAFEGNALKVIV
jgi:hypothetical protein